MRAVVLGPGGQPEVTEVPEPEGDGELVRVLACGLCGSDVEKLRPEHDGRVLGHEVVAETPDGTRVALVHHLPCGECERCRAGHESTCDRFREDTIRPGGFAERVRATGGWVELPDEGEASGWTAVEPLACVLRGAERLPPGRVLIVGHGFVGRLFAAVLLARGDEVFAVDLDPARTVGEPDGPVGAAVLCAPGGAERALAALEPGGTLLTFADAGALPADPIYRRELAVVGSRSATPEYMRTAVRVLPDLDLPEPTVVPLERFADGLELHRSRSVVKVVFTP